MEHSGLLSLAERFGQHLISHRSKENRLNEIRMEAGILVRKLNYNNPGER